jgi:hypothetical protein
MDIRARIAALLSNALGAPSYYGVFTANMHTDTLSAGADAIVDEATARGVPVVSARQMLTWLDARNASSFEGLEWENGELRFTIAPAPSANGLRAMVPVHTSGGELTSITRGGAAVSTQTETVKGIEYATFPAAAGAYVATYAQAPAGFVDDSVADFAAGAPGADTFVGASGTGTDGEVQLRPTVAEEFGGDALPAGWSTTPWDGGTDATVSGGSLHVNGARAGTTPAFAPGRAMEFTGSFAAAPFQHVGFGVDYNNVPWAMFSTGGGALSLGLYARTAPPFANTSIAGVSPTEPHRYRVVWRASGVDFFVDGEPVATHDVAIGDQMRPLASDLNAGGPEATVDWLRMSPYAGAGTFASRVFDAGAPGADWLTVTRTASAPGPSTLTLATRSGNTATPDGSWSGWQTVGPGDAIASPNARYLQYRAEMASSDDTLTPTLERVAVAYQP